MKKFPYFSTSQEVSTSENVEKVVSQWNEKRQSISEFLQKTRDKNPRAISAWILNLLLILAGLAMVFIASCSSEPDEILVETKTLQKMIDETESGGGLDLASVSDKALSGRSYTISKPITIKNGNKLQDATFVIKTSPVSFLSSKVDTVFVLVENAEIYADASTTIKTVYCQKDTTLRGEGDFGNKIYLSGTEMPTPTDKSDPLQKMIDDMESGGALDLADLSSDIATDKSYTILKPITIKNCSRLQNATFVIHSDSVSFAKAAVGKVILAKENITLSLDEATIEKVYCLYGLTKATINGESACENIIDTTKDSSLPPEDENAVLASWAKKYENTDLRIEGFKDKDGSYCTKITNAKVNKPESDMTKIWETAVWSSEVLRVEKGKNYEISIELKAEKESIVRIEAMDIDNYLVAPSAYYTLKANEWTTCTLQTGTVPETWVQGKLGIYIGFVETLYVKNFTIKEVNNGALGVNVYYHNYSEYPKVSYESKTADSLTVKMAGEVYNSGIDVVLPYDFKENTLYKVSFDVKGNVDASWQGTIIKTADNDDSGVFDDGSGKYGVILEAGVSQSITLFLPAIKNTQKPNQTYIPASLWVGSVFNNDKNENEKEFELSISCLKVEVFIPQEMTLTTADGNTVKLESHHLYKNKYIHRFENYSSSRPVVINAINYNEGVYAPKIDEDLFSTYSLQLYRNEDEVVFDGKMTLSVLYGEIPDFNFDFCVTDFGDYLQASVENISLIGIPDEKILYIVGGMNGWRFEVLKYTAVPVKESGVAPENGMWYYEFLKDDAIYVSGREFKVVTTPNWNNQVFVETGVDDTTFKSSERGTGSSSNASVICKISTGDKLCFYRNTADGLYYAKLVKSETSSPNETENPDAAETSE